MHANLGETRHGRSLNAVMKGQKRPYRAPHAQASYYLAHSHQASVLDSSAACREVRLFWESAGSARARLVSQAAASHPLAQMHRRAPPSALHAMEWQAATGVPGGDLREFILGRSQSPVRLFLFQLFWAGVARSTLGRVSACERRADRMESFRLVRSSRVSFVSFWFVTFWFVSLVRFVSQPITPRKAWPAAHEARHHQHQSVRAASRQREGQRWKSERAAPGS